MRLGSSTYSILKSRFGACAILGLLYIVVLTGTNIINRGAQEGGRATGDFWIAMAAMITGQVVSFFGRTYLQMAAAAFMLRLAREGNAGFDAVSFSGRFYVRSLLACFLIVLPQAIIVVVAMFCGMIFGRAMFGRHEAESWGLLFVMVSMFPVAWIGLVGCHPSGAPKCELS
jgi:hypothetical protein